MDQYNNRVDAEGYRSRRHGPPHAGPEPIFWLPGQASSSQVILRDEQVILRDEYGNRYDFAGATASNTCGRAKCSQRPRGRATHLPEGLGPATLHDIGNAEGGVVYVCRPRMFREDVRPRRELLAARLNVSVIVGTREPGEARMVGRSDQIALSDNHAAVAGEHVIAVGGAAGDIHATCIGAIPVV